MKAEFTQKNPKFNLMQADGIRSQTHSEDITNVLLTDGIWYLIEKGSFKFYKTSGDRAVPFIQFKVARGAFDAERGVSVAGKIVEVFPASVVGVAYLDDLDNAQFGDVLRGDQ